MLKQLVQLNNVTMHKQMNNVTMHKAANGKPKKVKSNQTSEPQSFLSQFGSAESAINIE